MKHVTDLELSLVQLRQLVTIVMGTEKYDDNKAFLPFLQLVQNVMVLDKWWDPCGTCNGAGKKKKKVDLQVKIPAGIDQGQRLKLSNEGDAGSLGGPNGDLYVVINIKKHQIFERDEFDVHCTVPISFTQAALGAEMEVPTLAVKLP